MGRFSMGMLTAGAVTLVTLSSPATAATPAVQSTSADPVAGGAALGPSSSGAVDGRIAYVHHGQVVTIEPDGSEATVLTDAGRNLGPTWSPDGTQIAYVHLRGGHANLWIMDADGSNKVAVTATGQVSTGGASWSPDGAELAFGGPCIGDAQVCNDYFDTHFALDTISSDARKGVPVTSLAADGSVLEVLDRVSWSSVGDRIALTTSGFGSYPGDEFVVVFTPSSGESELVQMVGAGGVYGNLAYPAFSPDGELLAYDADIYAQPEIIHEGIVVCGYPDGACDFRDVRHDSQLAFAPSQDRVVLVRDLDRDRLVLAGPDGRNRTRLANGSQPSWQPVTAG